MAVRQEAKFMSPGTDTSIQKIKWPLPNGPKARGKRQAAIPGEIPPESTSNSTLPARPLARIFQRSIRFVNCRQRAPIRTPVRKEGQARNREIALEPTEILSTRRLRLRLVANWQQTLVFAPSFPPSGDAAGIHSLAQHLTAHPLNSEARRRCPPTFLFAPPCLR